MIFKYAEFKNFICYTKGFGNIVPLCEWNTSNAIILRHDVDFDVEAAYRLALIEAEHDIRSTFFFLTTCHTYNLFSIPNRIKLCEIAKLGFEIGLHFDPTVYGNLSVQKLEVLADQESEMLSLITGVPIKSISLHNPSIHERYPLFKKYNNAYDKKFFSDVCYLSDSRMDFRGKNPYTFVKKIKEYPIQILLHPLHYSEDNLTYPDIIYEHIKSYTDVIHSRFLLNSTYHTKMSSQDLLSHMVNK